MKPFDVYPLFNINPQKALNYNIWDDNNNKYIDLYGGHAVISIGHSHPYYINKINEQLNKIAFYSNSVINDLQTELAYKLGEISSMQDYNIFLCNSGAEANENALKIASFFTGKKKVISFNKAFHGRTSAAVAITDNPKIIAPINSNHDSVKVELNNIEAVEKEISKGDVCAVIIEGIQGIGGIIVPDADFLKNLKELCTKNNVLLILDEIQSGYGRSGKFFAFQYADIMPDIVTVAKGMGNGFPIGGVLIAPEYKAHYGMLGTTFGGNHLACAAAIAVLDIIKNEKLIENTNTIGSYFINELKNNFKNIQVRGLGLMIGIEFEKNISEIRRNLLFEDKIFTGVAGSNIIRLLPPLTINKNIVDIFINKLSKQISKT